MRRYVVSLVLAVALGAFGATNVGALGLAGASDAGRASAPSAVEECTDLLLAHGAAGKAPDAGDEDVLLEAAEMRCSGLAGAAASVTAAP